MFNLLAFILFLHVKCLKTCGSKLVKHLLHAGLIHPARNSACGRILGVNLAVKRAEKNSTRLREYEASWCESGCPLLRCQFEAWFLFIRAYCFGLGCSKLSILSVSPPIQVWWSEEWSCEAELGCGLALEEQDKLGLLVYLPWASQVQCSVMHRVKEKLWVNASCQNGVLSSNISGCDPGRR